MRSPMWTAVLLIGPLAYAAQPGSMFQRPVVIQAPHVPARTPRASRRRVISLDSLPGDTAFEKLRSLYNSKIETAPSKDDLTGFRSGWISYADASDKADGALLVGAAVSAPKRARWLLNVFSGPAARLDAYDHLTNVEMGYFKKYLNDNGAQAFDPKFSPDQASYTIQKGPYQGVTYSFRKLKEGIAVRATHAGRGDLMYAYFFKTVTPPVQ